MVKKYSFKDVDVLIITSPTKVCLKSYDEEKCIKIGKGEIISDEFGYQINDGITISDGIVIGETEKGEKYLGFSLNGEYSKLYRLPTSLHITIDLK